MPDIAIDKKPFYNVDDIANKSIFSEYIDFEKDDFMSNRTRPGLQYFADTGSGEGIDGIFHVKNYNIAAVFSGGYLYKLESDGTVTAITGGHINTGYPVTYADFGDVGYFANKSRILKWDYSLSTCSYVGPSATIPDKVVSLGFIDQYLLALEYGSSRFEFSDVNTPETWLGEYVTAESRPDKAVAMFCNFGEIAVFGNSTIEYFADSGDPTQPFQRLSGAITERGTFSPYSIALIDNSYFFIDNERRVIRLAGRQPEVISNDIDKKLHALTDVTDAIGFHFNAEGATKYVLSFPTDLKTYVYDYKLQYWSEWSYWDQTTGTRSIYKGSTGHYIPTWNRYIVGDRENGYLYTATRSYGYDNGDLITPEFVTSRIDWDSSNRKSSTRLRFKIQRGTNGLTDTDTPKLFISKRDNGKTQWSQDREILIGNPGDEESYATLRNLGQYRDRQYRVRAHGANTTILRMTEDIEVLP